MPLAEAPNPALDEEIISSLTEDLDRSTLTDDARELIKSTAPLSSIVASVVDLPTNSPSHYIDLEDINLSRQGCISILQIHVAPHKNSYLIDTHILGSKAFDGDGKKDCTLRSVL
jgi:exonuclease 3'-5' domain-containing protein 1